MQTAAETVIHGTPSGLDNTTSCYGGAVEFVKREGSMNFTRLTTLPALDILLINTAVPRSTKVLVSKVRSLHDAYPAVVKPILGAIEQISLQFIQICRCCIRYISSFSLNSIL